MIQQVLDRRQRCYHTVIIRNIAVGILRYVKVTTHQNLLAGNMICKFWDSQLNALGCGVIAGTTIPIAISVGIVSFSCV